MHQTTAVKEHAEPDGEAAPEGATTDESASDYEGVLMSTVV